MFCRGRYKNSVDWLIDWLIENLMASTVANDLRITEFCENRFTGFSVMLVTNKKKLTIDPTNPVENITSLAEVIRCKDIIMVISPLAGDSKNLRMVSPRVRRPAHRAISGARSSWLYSRQHRVVLGDVAILSRYRCSVFHGISTVSITASEWVSAVSKV